MLPHVVLTLLALLPPALSQTVIPPSSWNYSYPWPVQYHNLTSQRLSLSMAYMDIAPTSTSPTPNTTQTIVLLHGKNFCGATWSSTASLLSHHGYRVIIPDQIGFCKSSKPPSYQFSLHQLASNTQSLLTSLNLTEVTLLGHSMGGMLATRFALMYPSTVPTLILTNPLGLEDWKALGVPWRPLDLLFADELRTNYTSVRTYQQATYYANTWKPAYDVWVDMLVSLYELPGEEGKAFAYDMALTTDAVLTQPVVYEFGMVRARTLLVIGKRDNTAIGKAWSPAEVRERLGNYSVLGREAAGRIPGAELVEFEELGHAPQIQDGERFHEALLGWLEKRG